jgi:hypothetical protein
MIELFSAALCVSLRYKGYFNAEIAEIRRGPQSSIPGREEMMRKLNTRVVGRRFGQVGPGPG